ncbi:hypothetical protein JW823_06915 [bacterium]|nr:hypothetical protein [candidate division CSSED10-310 bacterium]
MNECITNSRKTATRVIFKETRQAGYEVKKLMIAAREHAEQVISAAKAEAETIRTSAYQEGMDAGKKEAMSLVLDANRYRADLEMSSRREIVNLCMTLVQKLVAIHKRDYPQWIVDRVVLGLKSLKENRAIKVRINPQDLEMYKDRLQTIADDEAWNSTVRFIADSSLETGDCVFESQSGEIDSRTSACMKLLEQFLTDTLSDD